VRPSTFFALPLLLVPAAALGQTTTTDSQTLQSLLAEVRQLRQDLRTATLAAQRAQILIYRVQAQEAVVRHAQDRIDENRSKLGQIRFEQKRLATQIKEFEDQLGRSETSQTDRKEIEQALPQLRTSLERHASSEQETQPKLMEAEEQLRIEQAKLGRLQDELDRLDKALEDSSRQAAKPQ